MTSVHVVRLWGRLIVVPQRPDQSTITMVSSALRDVDVRGVEHLPIVSFTHQHLSRSAA